MANDTEIQDESNAVDRNIRAISEERIRLRVDRRMDERIIQEVANFVGSPVSLYLHGIFYGVFVLAGWRSVDRVAALESIFLAVFVLINQGSNQREERRNSDLHLQMSLLSEHELTRIARLTDLIARHQGIPTESMNGLKETKADVDPKDILKKISDHERK